MRLLYYYGKIEKFDKTETDYVSINYSREYEFRHRTKDFFSCKNDVLELDISFAEKKLPSNFWSKNEKIYNCTVFIGENGSGKSTILQDTIASILRINREFYSGEVLMVFWNKGTIHAIARINDDIFYTSAGIFNENGYTLLKLNKVDSPKTEDTSPVKDLFNLLNATKISFISNAFSQNDLLDYVNRYFNLSIKDKNSLNSRLYNYSMAYKVTMISKAGGEGFTLSDQMNVYWSIRYKDEARFILSDRAKQLSLKYRENCDFDFKIPNIIKIKYASSLEDVLNATMVKTTNNSIKQLFDLVLESNNSAKRLENVSEPDYRAAFYISVYALLQSTVNIENSDSINNGIGDIIKKYGDESKGSISVDDQKDILKDIKQLIKNTIENELKDNIIRGRWVGRVENEYNNARVSLEKTYELVIYLYKTEVMTKFKMVYPPVSNSVELQATTDSLRGNCDEFTVFIDKYTDTLKFLPRHYLSFSWGLSSGEDYILDLLASLNVMKTGIDKQVQTIQIYLDEADMGLHPEWQRKWLYVFPQMVEELFEDTSVDDIQLVLATHSPLLLGDIPSRCAKYVQCSQDGKTTIKERLYDEEGEVDTFGQNLYTILRNGFFLKKGAIGEIAIKKSEEIASAFEKLRKLKKDLNTKEKIEKEIEDDLLEIERKINSEISRRLHMNLDLEETEKRINSEILSKLQNNLSFKEKNENEKDIINDLEEIEKRINLEVLSKLQKTLDNDKKNEIEGCLKEVERRINSEILKKLKMDFDKEENIVKEIKDNLEDIKNENTKALEVIKKDSIEFFGESENVKTIKTKSGIDIQIECGAYLHYIDMLIKLYSGFIKEQLMKEFMDIMLYFYKDERTHLIEAIDEEIERLNKQKKKWE